MKFLIKLNFFVIMAAILAPQCKADSLETNLKEPELKQTSFFGWLISIFQIYPVTVKPVTAVPPVTITPPSEPRECQPCTCGTGNVVNRIVGGQETREILYPWMTLLKNNNRFYCGGTLVSDQYVVTAAHCLKGFTAYRLSVSLLVHDRKANSSREIHRKVQQVLIHEHYNPSKINNDIGIMKLSEPVKMSNILRPVCMPMANKTYLNETGIVSGWGATSEGGTLASKLMHVMVPIISNEECSRKYGEGHITENMLCAGVNEGNKDSCQGDSGGPLHVHNKDLNIYHLAGIVSWGKGCARPNLPGVYTRVTNYLDWIERHTNDSCRCDMPESKLMEVVNWEK